MNLLHLNQHQLLYSLDTSALIDAYQVWYPLENFPSFWQKMVELIKNNRLKMAQFAFEEAMRESDIKQWCSENDLKPYLQVSVDAAQQTTVRQILAQFPKLLDTRTGKSGADPWVIALAMRSHNCVVVTHEKPTGRPNRPKIPDVCQARSIECVDIAAVIKKEGWIF